MTNIYFLNFSVKTLKISENTINIIKMIKPIFETLKAADSVTTEYTFPCFYNKIEILLFYIVYLLANNNK